MSRPMCRFKSIRVSIKLSRKKLVSLLIILLSISFFGPRQKKRNSTNNFVEGNKKLKTNGYKGNVTVCTCNTGKCTRAAKNPHYEAHYVNAFAAVAQDMNEFGYNTDVITEDEIFSKVPALTRKRNRILNRKVFNQVILSDIIICGLPMMWKLVHASKISSNEIIEINSSFVVVEFTDPANLLPFRFRRDQHMLKGWNDNIYEDERIKAIVLHTTLKPIELNNNLTYLGSYYYGELLRIFYPKKDMLISTRYPVLSDRVLRKIRVLVPHVGRYMNECLSYVWGSHEQEICNLSQNSNKSELLLQAGNIPTMSQRDIDVFYAASYHGDCNMINDEKMPGSRRLVSQHRCHIDEILRKIQRQYKTLRIEIKRGVAALQNSTVHPKNVIEEIRAREKKKFYELVKRSKICISPGGFGEFATKDFEIVLLGCVILKPGSMKLAQYGNLYESDSSLTSSFDISDLENVIVSNLGRPRDLELKAMRANEKLKDSMEEFPRKIAHLFDEIRK